jgi:peptide/nickel transport system substrate-binding protein
VGEQPGHPVEIKNLQGQPELDTRTNEGYYMLRGAHISEIDIWTYPDWLFPIVNRYYFPLEGRYYAKGKDTCVPDPNIPYDCGVKPEPGSPGAVLQDLYDRGLREKDVQKRHELVWEAIRSVHIEEGPFVIGVAGDQQHAHRCQGLHAQHPRLRRGWPLGPGDPRQPGCRAVVDGPVNGHND